MSDPAATGRVSADAPDDQLGAAAAGGDRRALELLLERHADRIHAVCRRVLGHPEDALDATQEAMIAVARGIARFDGRSAFTTWLYRVATNAALDERRRRSRRPDPVDSLPEPPPPTRRRSRVASAPESTSTPRSRGCPRSSGWR